MQSICNAHGYMQTDIVYMQYVLVIIIQLTIRDNKIIT